ncbi:hypothetical protein HanIR_Chr15g0769961 [Helianthus annuus]|nr:hypothetical protein HanIR_Chr15g0769961 [Helianthus annuus]
MVLDTCSSDFICRTIISMLALNGLLNEFHDPFLLVLYFGEVYAWLISMIVGNEIYRIKLSIMCA